MDHTRPRRSARLRVLWGVGGGTLSALLLPTSALAHGLIGKTDLPIPKWLFAWAAAIVLVISFVALGTLWPKPRLEAIKAKAGWRYPRLFEPLFGLFGIASFVIVVYAGFAGEQGDPTTNILPTWIYVIFWVGVPFASVVLGDMFAPFNPWRAFARAIAWVARHMRRGKASSDPLAYPDWLGYWPAIVGIVAFGWLELVYINHDSPSTLAFLSLLYAAIQLIGMSLFGIELWTQRADAFSVYFSVYARVAPLRWSQGRVWRQAPFVGALEFPTLAGSVALLIVMIGVTSFDGFSFGAAWVGQNGLFIQLLSVFQNLGFGIASASELTDTVGLIAMIALIAAFFRLGIIGMRSIGGGHDTKELSQRFVHTLVPISVAYVIAHYFSLLAYSGQAMGYLISDPLGEGANYFGTAAFQINYSLVSANMIWYVQVAALLIGHTAGLTLAHDRALTIYRRARDASRSQYWMLAVMVGFTSLGLWILSSTY